MNKLASRPTIKWGKYQGLYVEDVITRDPRYIKWLVDQKGFKVPTGLQLVLTFELNKRDKAHEKFNRYRDI